MDKEFKIKSQIKSKVTKVYFGVETIFEKNLPNLLEAESRKCAIIIDSNLLKHYQTKLQQFDLPIFSFPTGEGAKTRETKQMLEDHLLSHNFTRDTLIIGMGGGVTNDLSGFLAATFCRGVSHIQIPTSLLAMVDASIGGKTGVNCLYGKNMIGAFHPPEEVWIDGRFLSTLPKRQLLSGIVELLKAGLIASPSLFDAMKKYPQKWQKDDLTFMMDRIFEGVSVKADVVEEDPEERKGIRRILNLGHTFGHAIESIEGYQIEHGEAVAIGILGSGYMSSMMNLLPEEDLMEIWEVFKTYQIPLKLKQPLDIDQVMGILALDKKALRSKPRIVLLEKIGQVAPFGCQYCTEVEFDLIDKTVRWMNEQFAT